MKNTKFVVSLAAILVLSLLLVSSASAFADISSIEVNGVEAISGNVNIGAFAGQTLPVRVTFYATADATDARVKVWLTGEKENAVSSERFDVLNGSTYSRVVLVQIPSDIDPSEKFVLDALVESRKDGVGDEALVNVTAQRSSYSIEVLDVNAPLKARSGDAIPVDIVLKNRGMHFAEDTFVKVKVTSLGLEQRAYFGDLSPLDQSNPDKEDAVEGRMYFNIPRSTPSGIYTLEVEAYNADSEATVTKKFAVVGASEDTLVVSNTGSKSFNVGESEEYSITLVNTGSRVAVYELTPEATDKDLSVSLEEPVVAVPAGTSKTVKTNVVAKDGGQYNFAIDVTSNGELVKKAAFTANVENKGFGSNTTVLLTVILAIIFIVLLVVLIVLLTRKPEKTEEFGESYY